MANWKFSPDGRIKKIIVREGDWLDKPTEGSRCTYNICDNKSLPITNKEVLIGDADGSLYASIELCLRTMHVGEESIFEFMELGESVKITMELVSLVFNGHIFEWDSKQIYEYAQYHREKGRQFWTVGKKKDAGYRFTKALKLICLIPIDVENEPEIIDNVPLKDIINFKISIYNLLSTCYTNCELWPQVISYCERLLDLDDNNLDALYKAGVAYKYERNLDKALVCFQKILKLEPQNNAALVYLNVVKEEMTEEKVKVDSMIKNMFPGLQRK